MSALSSTPPLGVADLFAIPRVEHPSLSKCMACSCTHFTIGMYPVLGIGLCCSECIQQMREADA